MPKKITLLVDYYLTTDYNFIYLSSRLENIEKKISNSIQENQHYRSIPTPYIVFSFMYIRIFILIAYKSHECNE